MNKLLPCILQITLLLVALFGYSTTYAQKNQWLEAEIQSFETQIASSTNRHQLIYTISNNPEFSLHEKIVVLDSIVQLMPIRQDLNSLELVSQIGDSLCTEAMKGAQGGEEKAFTLSKSAQFNFMLGMIQYQKTDFNAANSFIDKSLSLSNQLTHPNKKLVANCYNVQAIIKCEQGRYDEGIKLFYQSEKILEELGNSNEVANTRMNIALTFRTLGEYDKAISECNRAIAILNKNNSRGQTLGKLYNNLGGIYTDKKEYVQAKEHLERALEIQQEGADSNAIASVYSNYGNLYLKMGDTAMQLDYHKSAYAIYNSLGIQSGKATVGLKIAEVLFAKEPGSNEAYRLATEAMEIGTQNKIADVIQEAADLLHVYHARKQDYEKAYGFLELSGKYKDSILSDQNRNELFRQQNKYAYEKQKALDQAQLQANMDEEKRKRQLLYILIVFSILLIAIMSFAFIRKKRDNAKLKELNDKLNTSEHALLKLNASKDKFFAIISHDLRNPLAAFKNIAKQLLNSKGNLDNEQLADYISDIKVSADQLSELTENLLHWAQSQADLIEMKEAEIDLGIVASKFLLTNDTEAKQAGIDLSSEIPENLYVRADLNMLNTVFRNIIGNALKFTPAGGKVSISAEENEAELVVRISDTGIGIAEKDVEKMFHIEKDHKTIGNSKNKGSGLGLILCKEFVERNGGRIWVESKLGKGTTFYFTLKKAKS